MANGDPIEINDQHRMSYKLLDAQDVTSNGVWVEVPAWFNIRGFWADASESGASLNIMVSNAVTKPSDATAGPISMTLNSTTLAGVVIEPFRWVKCQKTQGGTPAASTVVMEAARNE